MNRYYTLPVSKKIRYILKDFKGFNMTYRQCYYQFTTMKQELQLDKDITIHTLRHSFCSNLVNKDVPLILVQRLANHKNISTTTRYTHTSDIQLIKAIEVL